MGLDMLWKIIAFAAVHFLHPCTSLVLTPRWLLRNRFCPFSLVTRSVPVVSRKLLIVAAKMPTGSAVENGVSLLSLADFDVDAKFLNDAIVKWLDSEYIKLDVHQKIGIELEHIYSAIRKEGVNDLGELLMTIGAHLENFDMEDAFVNCWDIANKVSDFLMLRLNRELCECGGDAAAIVKSLSPANTPSVPASSQCKDSSSNTDRSIENVRMQIPVNSKQFISMNGGIEVTPTALRTASRKFTSEFARFKYLQEFMDGEVGWDDLAPLWALVLGFRLCGSSTGGGTDDSSYCDASNSGILNTSSDGATIRNGEDDKILPEKSVAVCQMDALAPLGWAGLGSCVPDFSNLDDEALARRLADDLPDEDAATDILMEQIAGIEIYALMKSSGDALHRRRILVAKWLYTQGFLRAQFPATQQFVPAHLLEKLESDAREQADPLDDTW